MSNGFRLNAQYLFLTYPQCPELKETLRDLLMDKFGTNLVGYAIAQERHEDGSEHLHAYVQLNKRINWNNARCLDFNGYHGDYQSAKGSPQQCMAYITKEDKEPLQQGIDLKTTQAKSEQTKQIQRAQVTKDLIEKGPVVALKQGIISFRDFKAAELVVNAVRQYDIMELRQDRPYPLQITYEFTSTAKLQFLMHPRKQRHIYLWSTGPNYGKTTWLKQLDDQYRCSWYNTRENFQDNILEDSDFLIMDAFGGLKFIELEALCDGTAMVPRKGRAPLRMEFITIIACGNQSPDTIYADRANLFHARFRVCQLDMEEPPWRSTRIYK